MNKLTLNIILERISNRYPFTQKYISVILSIQMKYPKLFNSTLLILSFLIIYNFGKMIGEIGYFVSH
jgi:hypothetical membrane protein